MKAVASEEEFAEAEPVDEDFVNAVASEVLNEALDRFIKDGEELGILNTVKVSPEGEPVVFYEGESIEGFGAFFFYYMPSAVVKSIVANCVRRFDSIVIQHVVSGEVTKIQGIKFRDGKTSSEELRRRYIKNEAWLASMTMLTGLRQKIAITIAEMYEDSMLTAEAATQSVLARQFGAMVDSRAVVKDIGKERAAKRQKQLSALITSFGNVLAPSGKGRPSEWTMAKLEKAVVREVSAFHKRLYRAPTLRDVADLLNKRYQDRKPFTPDSLRMLLKAHGIEWMAIKKRR